MQQSLFVHLGATPTTVNIKETSSALQTVSRIFNDTALQQRAGTEALLITTIVIAAMPWLSIDFLQFSSPLALDGMKVACHPCGPAPAAEPACARPR